MRKFRIGDRVIDDDSPAYICAEVSHNHLGSFEMAKEMVRLASEAGADAVKFQMRSKDTYAGLKAGGEREYAEMRERRELSLGTHFDLKQYAHKLGLDYIVTAFDKDSAAALAVNWIGADAIKIASGDITNIPLIEYVAPLGKPMLVSTGGCEMEDVDLAVKVLKQHDAEFCLLHCTSEYPVKTENVNLRVIETYRQRYPETVIGFSSHIPRIAGPYAECVAYALGARVFEKHFTITPSINTGEHAFAVTQSELANLRCALGDTAIALGDGIKRKLPAERAGITRLGKHLAYSRALPSGHVLEGSDFAVRAPGDGVLPSRMPSLIGCTLLEAVEEGEAVKENHVHSDWGVELAV